MLRKLGTKDMVDEFGKWVFTEHPDIGLKMFTGDGTTKKRDPDSQYHAEEINMKPEEIVAFLEERQEVINQKERAKPGKKTLVSSDSDPKKNYLK